jgi:DNA-binding NtrC family response regulator
MYALMPDRKKEKIARKALIIEHDDGDALLIEEMLSSQGIDFIRANGGKEALEILSSNDFPVVITNLEMRDIDGFGIIDYLKRKKKESLVIVMTDHASIDSVIVAMRLGAYEYIIKPFAPEFLRYTVLKAFDFIFKREDQERLSQVGLIAELATTMSHEVFQPLTVLMGIAHDIQRASKDKEISDMAGEILTESRKIRDIIRKMDSLDPNMTKEFPGGHVIIDIEKGKNNP